MATLWGHGHTRMERVGPKAFYLTQFRVLESFLMDTTRESFSVEASPSIETLLLGCCEISITWSKIRYENEPMSRGLGL